MDAHYKQKETCLHDSFLFVYSAQKLKSIYKGNELTVIRCDISKG